MSIRRAGLLVIASFGAWSAAGCESEDANPTATPSPGSTATTDAEASPSPAQGVTSTPTATLAPGDFAPVEEWTFEGEDDSYHTVAATAEHVAVASAPNYPQVDLEPELWSLHLLERDTGVELWQKDLRCIPYFPAVDQERVYLPCSDGAVHAWNLDGTDAWTLPTKGAPVKVLVDGERLYAFDSDPESHGLVGVDQPEGVLPDTMELRAIDAGTGDVLWSRPTSWETFATLRGDLLVVSESSAAVAHEGVTVAIDTATGDVVWEAPTGDSRSYPFVTDNAVYVVGDELYRLALSDGSVAWNTDVPDGGVFEEPVVVGDRVVVGTNVSSMYVLDATTGEIVSEESYCDCPYYAREIEVQVMLAGAGVSVVRPDPFEPVWFYEGDARGEMLPVVADGWFFVPFDGRVVAHRYR
jgi:outer membrane protein assembly factor BamB